VTDRRDRNPVLARVQGFRCAQPLRLTPGAQHDSATCIESGDARNGHSLVGTRTGPTSAFAHRATADKEAGHYTDSRGNILETEGGETASRCNEKRKLVDQNGASWNRVLVWLNSLDGLRPSDSFDAGGSSRNP
jgi:hypothetical protein